MKCNLCSNTSETPVGNSAVVALIDTASGVVPLLVLATLGRSLFKTEGVPERAQTQTGGSQGCAGQGDEPRAAGGRGWLGAEGSPRIQAGCDPARFFFIRETMA